MLSKNLITVCCTALVFCSTLQAQYQEELYPNVEGQELLNSLVQDYKPVNILDYHEAREYLYTKVYNVDGRVECVYTGHSLAVSPDATNPIFQLSMLGSLNGIITEHTYPQSKGAETGNAESDMHHLVPARLGANVARLNHPFGEIEDSETNIWLIDDETLFNMPDGDLDAYSEQITGRFEPKESHKGNVARMVFYFYTMYKSEANEADPEFFDLQRETLCDWHLMDPVDQNEYDRTFIIAEEQEGKVNPFILDCTLAARTYCESNTVSCISTDTDEALENSLKFAVQPNPVKDNLSINFNLETAGQARLTIYDGLGRQLLSLIDEKLPLGAYNYTIPVHQYTQGFIIAQLTVTTPDGRIAQKTEKILIQ